MGKNNCWMCDENKRKYLDPESEINEIKKIEKLIDGENEDSDYYVIVPDPCLTEGEILIASKKHIEGLEGAVESCDFKKLNEPIKKWIKILKKAYDCRTVFLTCLCDSEDTKHFHYHLIPVKEEEKPYRGKGHIWLGLQELQRSVLVTPVRDLPEKTEKEKKEKLKRAEKFRSIVNKLIKAK